MADNQKDDNQTNSPEAFKDQDDFIQDELNIQD